MNELLYLTGRDYATAYYARTSHFPRWVPTTAAPFGGRRLWRRFGEVEARASAREVKADARKASRNAPRHP